MCACVASHTSAPQTAEKKKTNPQVGMARTKKAGREKARQRKLAEAQKKPPRGCYSDSDDVDDAGDEPIGEELSLGNVVVADEVRWSFMPL